MYGSWISELSTGRILAPFEDWAALLRTETAPQAGLLCLAAEAWILGLVTATILRQIYLFLYLLVPNFPRLTY